MVNSEEYLSILKNSGVPMPNIDALNTIAKRLVGVDSYELLDKFHRTVKCFTLSEPLIGVPGMNDYAQEIQRHSLFTEIKKIVDFLHCVYTPFNPNHPEIQPLAIDLLTAVAALAQDVGEGFNLLLPNTIGVDVKGGVGSKPIRLGEGREGIEVSLWRPQSFDHLPRSLSGKDGMNFTAFDLILKAPNSVVPNKGAFYISYK